MDVPPPDSTLIGPPAPPGPPDPSGPPPLRAVRRAGAGVGAVGGLGALAGFFLPWFIFVVAISGSCRQPLQVELYNLYGIAIALNGAGWPMAAFAIVALLCSVIIVIAAAMDYCACVALGWKRYGDQFPLCGKRQSLRHRSSGRESALAIHAADRGDAVSRAIRLVCPGHFATNTGLSGAQIRNREARPRVFLTSA